jgi:stringent starvation protein B
MINRDDMPSTRPYLIRALHEWCTENGFTPYIAVAVDATVQVPREFVKDNEIVLNASFDATSHLNLGNEFIEFKARFGGIPREVIIPVDHVIAVYARENGQGMAFPAPVLQTGDSNGSSSALQVVSSEPAQEAHETDPPVPPSGGRPALKRVK